MKKRSCRRTADENRIHAEAVKLRKMSDEQLVQYIEDIRGGTSQPETGNTVTDFLNLISNTKVPGIGIVTVNKLWKVAEEHGIS